ncbi:unnamed protein product [Acidithrix sp. C25]|nr:unnamed protein product [Acidithrix sp. C25]
MYGVGVIAISRISLLLVISVSWILLSLGFSCLLDFHP